MSDMYKCPGCGLECADDVLMKLRAERDALLDRVETLRRAGRDYLQKRYHECRAQASLETAQNNFSDGGEREKAEWISAALKASAAEKVLGALVFDDPPVKDAALAEKEKNG